MTRFLSLIGLMRRSEHEAKVRTLEEILANVDDDFGKLEAERDRLDDKFKKAVTDLEKQTAEIDAARRTTIDAVVMNKRLTESLAFIKRDRDHWREQALRDAPDAEAMRAKRARDRDQKAARRKERVQP